MELVPQHGPVVVVPGGERLVQDGDAVNSLLVLVYIKIKIIILRLFCVKIMKQIITLCVKIKKT